MAELLGQNLSAEIRRLRSYSRGAGVDKFDATRQMLNEGDRLCEEEREIISSHEATGEQSPQSWRDARKSVKRSKEAPDLGGMQESAPQGRSQELIQAELEEQAAKQAFEESIKQASAARKKLDDLRKRVLFAAGVKDYAAQASGAQAKFGEVRARVVAAAGIQQYASNLQQREVLSERAAQTRELRDFETVERAEKGRQLQEDAELQWSAQLHVQATASQDDEIGQQQPQVLTPDHVPKTPPSYPPALQLSQKPEQTNDVPPKVPGSTAKPPEKRAVATPPAKAQKPGDEPAAVVCEQDEMRSFTTIKMSPMSKEQALVKLEATTPKPKDSRTTPYPGVSLRNRRPSAVLQTVPGLGHHAWSDPCLPHRQKHGLVVAHLPQNQTSAACVALCVRDQVTVLAKVSVAERVAAITTMYPKDKCAVLAEMDDEPRLELLNGMTHSERDGSLRELQGYVQLQLEPELEQLNDKIEAARQSGVEKELDSEELELRLESMQEDLELERKREKIEELIAFIEEHLEADFEEELNVTVVKVTHDHVPKEVEGFVVKSVAGVTASEPCFDDLFKLVRTADRPLEIVFTNPVDGATVSHQWQEHQPLGMKWQKAVRKSGAPPPKPSVLSQRVHSQTMSSQPTEVKHESMQKWLQWSGCSQQISLCMPQHVHHFTHPLKVLDQGDRDHMVTQIQDTYEITEAARCSDYPRTRPRARSSGKNLDAN